MVDYIRKTKIALYADDSAFFFENKNITVLNVILDDKLNYTSHLKMLKL